MSATAEKHTPESVREMPDEVLGFHVLSATGLPVEFLHPGYAEDVAMVLEHMRKRWAATAPDLIHEYDWYISGWGTHWAVGRHHCGASGAEFPLHDGTLVKHASLGRAVMEVALLAAQEMENLAPQTE